MDEEGQSRKWKENWDALQRSVPII
jgi:hypothetical protein